MVAAMILFQGMIFHYNSGSYFAITPKAFFPSVLMVISGTTLEPRNPACILSIIAHEFTTKTIPMTTASLESGEEVHRLIRGYMVGL